MPAIFIRPPIRPLGFSRYSQKLSSLLLHPLFDRLCVVQNNPAARERLREPVLFSPAVQGRAADSKVLYGLAGSEQNGFISVFHFLSPCRLPEVSGQCLHHIYYAALRCAWSRYGLLAAAMAAIGAGDTLLPHIRTCSVFVNLRPSWPRSMM